MSLNVPHLLIDENKVDRFWPIKEANWFLSISIAYPFLNTLSQMIIYLWLILRERNSDVKLDFCGAY